MTNEFVAMMRTQYAMNLMGSQVRLGTETLEQAKAALEMTYQKMAKLYVHQASFPTDFQKALPREFKLAGVTGVEELQ